MNVEWRRMIGRGVATPLQPPARWESEKSSVWEGGGWKKKSDKNFIQKQWMNGLCGVFCLLFTWLMSRACYTDVIHDSIHNHSPLLTLCWNSSGDTNWMIGMSAGKHHFLEVKGWKPRHNKYSKWKLPSSNSNAERLTLFLLKSRKKTAKNGVFRIHLFGCRCLAISRGFSFWHRDFSSDQWRRETSSEHSQMGLDHFGQKPKKSDETDRKFEVLGLALWANLCFTSEQFYGYLMSPSSVA